MRQQHRNKEHPWPDYGPRMRLSLRHRNIQLRTATGCLQLDKSRRFRYCVVVLVWTALLLTGCRNVDKDTPLDAGPGKVQFESYCAPCHQRDGQGTQGRVPPLTASPWVSGFESRLIRIVLHGLRGPIEIHGKIYNLEMPAFGPVFKDEEIAVILSYVRQRYGAPSPPITAATIGQVRDATRNRTTYWTVDELLKVR